MPPSNQQQTNPGGKKLESELQPVWWTMQHTAIWELAEPSLRIEYERLRSDRYRAEMKEQGPDDSVFQAGASAPRNVDVDRAFEVSDVNWELEGEWEEVRPALRFGVGARFQYSSIVAWNEELETLLYVDWCRRYDPKSWPKLKRAVRRGFEFGSGD